MPNGSQRNHEKRVGPGNARAVAALTPEDKAEMNETRSPSEKIGTKEFCGAKLTSPDPDTGDPRYCSKSKGYGTDHLGFGYCKHHGGNTPAGRKAGARAMGRSIIEERRKSFGDKDLPENDLLPEQALLEEVRRSVAMVRWLEERIGAWEIPSLQELNDPKARLSPGEMNLAGLPALMEITFKGTPMATDVNSWLVLYREERQHMVKVSKLAIDAGIQERMVRIAEDQGKMLAVAVRAVLTALELSTAQAELVPHVVPHILRQVATASPTIEWQGKVLV